MGGWVAKVDNSFGYEKWTYYSRPLLMKEKKKTKICFVIHIAGEKKLLFLFAS